MRYLSDFYPKLYVVYMARNSWGDAQGFLNPHLKKFMLSFSLYCHVLFSWDVVDVGFPTCSIYIFECHVTNAIIKQTVI
jgi:hypothetical protein